MSSTITKVNGVVVVTQVFPKAGTETGEGEGPGPGNTNTNPNLDPGPLVYAPAKVSEMTAAFLRGEPQALGIVQIFVGLLCMSSGAIGFLSHSQMVQLPLLASVTFIVSGSVAVAAKRGTNIRMIRATLGLHVLSALVSLAGVCFVCWLLATQAYPALLCPLEGGQCSRVLWSLQRTLSAVWGLVLVLVVAEFCISVSLCVFSGRALGRRDYYTSPMVVVGDYSPTAESAVNLLDHAAVNEPSVA